MTETDPRVTRTQLAVDAAVWALVVEEETADIPLIDVARRAGISRQTLYANYKNRDAVIAQVAVRSLHAAIERGRMESPRRQDLTEAILRHLREHHGFYVHLFEQRSGHFCRALEEFFTQRAERKLTARLGRDAAAVPTFVAGGSIAVIREWLFAPIDTRPSATCVAEQIDAMFTRLTTVTHDEEPRSTA